MLIGNKWLFQFDNHLEREIMLCFDSKLNYVMLWELNCVFIRDTNVSKLGTNYVTTGDKHAS